MKKFLGSLALLFFIFYHIFPQALPVFGSSFIFGSGIIGLIYYLINKTPFKEVVYMLLAYLPFVVIAFISGYINNTFDPYLWNNTKTQVGWLFSALLISYIFFYVHPKGSYTTFLTYIIIAILVQGIISVAMFQDPAIKNFFESIQMADSLARFKREETEGERLIGYGIAFFGAGVIYGAGLILIAFIMIKKKLNLIQLIIWGAIYTFIFFVGLLSARTTMVGLAISIIMAIIILFFGRNTHKFQLLRFVGLVVLFSSIGYTLCYLYFPEFSDWAFEAFINYQETGEFSTKSSDSLQYMFILPTNFHGWIFGFGPMSSWVSDVGYSRLLFYGGLPITLAFFFFQFYLAKSALTKDFSQNLMMLCFFVYSLILNVKGLADVNSFLFLIIFYFLYYKYFIYTPRLHGQRKIDSNKLHYAVQSSSSRRRISGNV